MLPYPRIMAKRGMLTPLGSSDVPVSLAAQARAAVCIRQNLVSVNGVSRLAINVLSEQKLDP